MEPLELALTNAFKNLGYKEPEIEAKAFVSKYGWISHAILFAKRI